MCDMQAFEFVISVSLKRAWTRESFEDIVVLSLTCNGSSRGDRAGLISDVHCKRQEVTDSSYSKKNSAGI